MQGRSMVMPRQLFLLLVHQPGDVAETRIDRGAEGADDDRHAQCTDERWHGIDGMAHAESVDAIYEVDEQKGEREDGDRDCRQGDF